jgi:hypothetical protein
MENRAIGLFKSHARQPLVCRGSGRNISAITQSRRAEGWVQRREDPWFLLQDAIRTHKSIQTPLSHLLAGAASAV